MSFSIPLKKQKIDNKCVTYNLKFIDSIRFMNESLSSLVDNLSELYICKCLNKKEQDIKIKYKQKNNIKIVYARCKSCNTKNKQLLDSLIKRFPSTYKISNNNIDKFL